jgi:hypothetical protein
LAEKNGPFTVKVRTSACSECGDGATWLVVGPVGVPDEPFYVRKDAEAERDRMNQIWLHGYEQ